MRNHGGRRLMRVSGHVHRWLKHLAVTLEKHTAETKSVPDMEDIASGSQIAVDGHIASHVVVETIVTRRPAHEIQKESAVGAVADQLRFERSHFAVVAIAV